MNECRVLRKGSGVVFGESVSYVVRRCPKTTPDPVRVAYHQTKSDSYSLAGLDRPGILIFLTVYPR
jgi:hypothetical protein